MSPRTLKAIRRQVDRANVVGFIAAHRPDFEFANFEVTELAEIAARIDESTATRARSSEMQIGRE
jgi:hypothetical protein